MLVINDNGDPSPALKDVMAPEFRIKKVLKEFIGSCEPQKPEQPFPPTVSSYNFPPLFKNPIDRIDSTVGELLVYRVPEVIYLLISDNYLLHSYLIYQK